MRKIEAQMNAAIRARRDWSKSNTEVQVWNHGNHNETRVYLHGNLICRINHNTGTRQFYSRGWHTVTTKSRLNALGADLRIKDYSLINRDGTPFTEGQEIKY